MFSANPADELGVVHSVDRVNLLLAAYYAAREVTQVEPIKLHAELTALRIGHRLREFWDGTKVPSLDSVFGKEEQDSEEDNGQWIEVGSSR